MGDEGDPARPLVPAVSHATGHHRPETVSPDGQTGTDRSAASPAVAEHGSSHRSPLVQQLFHRRALGDGCAGFAGNVQQRLIEDTARNRESGGAVWPMTCQSKDAMRGGPVNAGDFHPLEGSCPRCLERLDNAEPGEDSHCFRTHVLGAWLVARELGPVYRNHGITGLGQQGGGGAAGRTSSDNEYVYLAGEVSQASATRPRPGRR